MWTKCHMQYRSSILCYVFKKRGEFVFEKSICFMKGLDECKRARSTRKERIKLKATSERFCTRRVDLYVMHHLLVVWLEFTDVVVHTLVETR